MKKPPLTPAGAAPVAAPKPRKVGFADRARALRDNLKRRKAAPGPKAPPPESGA